VVALRTMAADVVSSELARMDGRLPHLDDKERAEIAQTVRRVVDKLLHAPTVRVKQLAGEPGGAGYADALRELFDLDPQAVAAVSPGGLPGHALCESRPMNEWDARHRRGWRERRSARLGTRRSRLAMVQSAQVRGRGHAVDRPPSGTGGDHHLRGHLAGGAWRRSAVPGCSSPRSATHCSPG